MIRFWSRSNSIMLNKYRILFTFPYHLSNYPNSFIHRSIFHLLLPSLSGFGVVLLQPEANPLTDASHTVATTLRVQMVDIFKGIAHHSSAKLDLGFVKTWHYSPSPFVTPTPLVAKDIWMQHVSGLCSVNFHWQPPPAKLPTFLRVTPRVLIEYAHYGTWPGECLSLSQLETKLL